jgi:hypothetical protein
VDPFGSQVIRLPHGSRVRAIAGGILNTPAFRGVVEVARKAINRRAEGAEAVLAWHLAQAYAWGYVQGWDTARTQRGDAPPPPPQEPA